jgi:aryl-alcohol dehydrogenase-like predicted oxidoreductase
VRYRTLGRTGLRVSAIGFGGGGIGSVWGPTTDAESIRAVRRALDLGISFFDVAPVYGDGTAEARLGQALGADRASVIVATKVQVDPRRLGDVAAHVAESLEGSLRRLRTDYVDLLQVHNHVASRRDVPFEGALPAADVLRVADGFQRLREAGKVRHLGFTAWRGHPGELRRLLDSGVFDTLQTEYSLLNQSAQEAPRPGMDIESADAMEARGPVPILSYRYRPVDQGLVIPAAAARGVGVIAIRPLVAGVLSDAVDRPVEPGRYMETMLARARALAFLAIPGRRTLAQAAITFSLMNPHVATVIPGSKNAAEIEAAAACADAPPLAPAELDRIAQLYRTNFGVP